MQHHKVDWFEAQEIMDILKQSPKKGYKKFDFFMVRQGYTRSEYNHCLCFKSLNDIFIILVLYVENMLIVSKSMEKINKLKVHMARNFDMKDLGAKTKILCIEIHKHKRNCKLIFP